MVPSRDSNLVRLRAADGVRLGEPGPTGCDIAYLREENCVLREQLGGKRPKLTDAQRRRLAEKGKALGRKVLAELSSIATPYTILVVGA